MREPDAPPDVFHVGEILAETFEIRALLGAGAMGQVFEAHDLALNRRVAIKAAWPHVPAEMLRREAQAIAAIRHPGMISIYGVGRHREVPYVVMERLYGLTLEDHLQNRREGAVPFGIGEVLEILAGLAEGLAAVHRGGVAHRDVKPDNVMLSPGNRVILMDFGIVLPEFEAKAGASVDGSPAYMAPETISEGVSPGDAFRVDLYALGVIAYEMLTGELPYDRASVPEMLIAHLHAPIPDVAAKRPDVPPKLARLVTELMAKDPLERPPSMDAVAFQLRALSRASSPKDPTPREAGASSFSVVVVDDDPHIARLLAYYAKKGASDAEVRVFHDAESALRALQQAPADVMLLDLHMPRMNGVEVCMFLRGTPLAERMTIVSVSAGAQAHDVQLLQQLGITRFVPKDEQLSMRIASTVRELRARR